jgi:hypothetical protein
MTAWRVPAAEWFRKLRAVMVGAPFDFPERAVTIQNATWAITLLDGMVEYPSPVPCPNGYLGCKCQAPMDAPRCACTHEAGDSPCPVHGMDEEGTP